jgi:type IX secretion system PorP/SprF family membrane protein
MYKLSFIIVFILELICIKSISQSKFSQFYSNPLLINPANTGRFNKSYRIAVIGKTERNTFNQVFSSKSFSLDGKILDKVTKENDCFAIGFSGQDEKGIDEGIKNSYFSASLSYNKSLSEDGRQQIIIGFQATAAQKKLSKPPLIFEDQLLEWFRSGYSIDIFNFQGVNVAYKDISAGFIYQGEVNKTNLFSVGASLYGITKPRVIFQGGELNIDRELKASISWEKTLQKNQKINSALFFNNTRKKIDYLLCGFTYQGDINAYNQYIVGLWYRNSLRGNFIVPNFGMNFKSFSLLTSYDANFSSKKKSQKGGFEVSLIFKGATSKEKYLEKRFIKL